MYKRLRQDNLPAAFDLSIGCYVLSFAFWPHPLVFWNAILILRRPLPCTYPDASVPSPARQVCSRVVGLLPARVCITPLLPAGPVPPLLQLSHAGIRAQLVAHCGATVARVLEELRLAAACGGAFVSMREAVQQVCRMGAQPDTRLSTQTFSSH